MPKLPDCPHCDANQTTSLIAFVVKRDHVMDIYVCSCCAKTFEVRVDDQQDQRLMQMRSR